MKNVLLSLATAAIGGYAYLHHNQPATAMTLPDGHHRAPEGVYYLRSAYNVPTSGGPVQWTSGQTLYEDHRVLSPAVGMVAVTDGTHNAQVLAGMLSQDQEEGSALRSADANAQARAAREQMPAQMRTPLGAPAQSYVSPLEQSSRPVDRVYYNPGYSTVVEVRRNANERVFQENERPRQMRVPPPRPVNTTLTH